ncbi:ATP-binding protein [Streptomyces sp. C10-9-1]|uniref:ATP-binding protein n=1 Tax=Streptomyces sp. C10-9-1 TaxID=1859285 RepID=UPI003D754D26
MIPDSDNPLAGLPSRAEIAAMILNKRPLRHTLAGWQHYRSRRGRLAPAPKMTARQLAAVPVDRRSDYDLYRRLTNVNLPIQQTPMLGKVTRVINRRLQGNALDQEDPTMPGIMVSGWGNHGKTATVCSIAAAFEDMWLDLHDHLNLASIPGTWDLHAPVAYIATPVTAKPKSLCQAILNFFGPDHGKWTLPQLSHQVADSLRDHGVKVLIIDDVNRLRMHRADDQDVLDLVRALMGFNVTLILTGVNIPGTGLLREATWDRTKRQWVLPPLETTRVHGLEVTQTERRFELVELDRFRYDTPAEMQAFLNHLRGIEVHLRLAKAKKGMLTANGMPEYLMRRTDGVVGTLGRLISDGAQEAMDSGKELIDESLLDEVVIGRDIPADEARPFGAATAPADPGTANAPGSKKSNNRRPGRNTVFDDSGPAAEGLNG